MPPGRRQVFSLPSNYSSRLGFTANFKSQGLVAELVIDGRHTDPETPPPVPTTMPSKWCAVRSEALFLNIQVHIDQLRYRAAVFSYSMLLNGPLSNRGVGKILLRLADCVAPLMALDQRRQSLFHPTIFPSSILDLFLQSFALHL